MSTWELRTFPCPRCGGPQEVRVARSINLSRAPQVFMQILEGSLHRFTCSACTEPFVVDVAFEYIDFARKQLFMVFPETDEPRWREREQVPAAAFERNFGDAAPPRVRELGVGFRVRAVFGLAQLREKLMVFEWGIDDTVVEAWKLAWMRAAPFARLAPDHRPRLDSRPSGQLRFVARERGGELVVLDGDLADLRAHPATDPSLAALSAGPYVDVGRFLFDA